MFQEIKELVGYWRIWAVITIYKIVLRYRRTYFGTLWIPVGLVLIVLAKGILFSVILQVPSEKIIPNIAVGLMMWRFIAGILVTSCSSISAFKKDFECGYLPLFTPLLSVVIDQLIILAHCIIPIVIIILFYITPEPSAILICLLGLFLIIFTLLPAGFLLAIFCIRFRDVTHLIQSNMRVIYFLTPVLWLPEMVTGNYIWALWLNPFYHLIEVFRDPLTSQPIELLNWIVVLLLGLFCWTCVYIYFVKFGRRVLHWL